MFSPLAVLAARLPIQAEDPAVLTGIAGWAVGIMEWMREPGVALLILLENLFPPIPSEVVLPLAGFTASRGTLSLLAAIIWATAGSVIGAIILYYVGKVLGRERTRKIMEWLPLVNPADVDRTEKWFDKHGPKTVLIGRVVPIFRSLISIPAGVTDMKMRTFVALTTIGSLVWNTALIYAGYALGENWGVVEGYVGILSKVVIVLVLLALVWFVFVHLRARRAGAPATGVDGSAASETEAEGDTPAP